MTEPAPLPTEPLLTQAKLSIWAQEGPPLDDPALADEIIEAVSVLLRMYGDPYWEISTLPARARDIGYIVAKDYYLNPRQLRQETTGPLQESLDNSVLHGINLTDEQKAELASLSSTEPPGTFDGLWSFSTTRDDPLIHSGRNSRGGTVVVYDTRGEWPIEYLDGADVIVFVPEEPEP
jgi:hypothetical protein